METKICKKCNIEKSINDFRIKFEKRFNKSYLYSYCKDCEKLYLKEYALNNKEKIKKYHEKNNKKYNSDKQYHKEYQKKYYEKHRKEINQKGVKYKNKRKEDDGLYKLKEQIRTLIWVAFNNKGFSKSEKTEKILGCTFKYFYNYLLQTFKDNYGYEYNSNENVHIDHIMPLKYAKTKEDIIKLNHYTNLQLLKAKDNMEKSDKLNWELII